VRPATGDRGRARAAMEEAGIAAVVSWRPLNVRYLTGYWCWLAPLFEECMVAAGGSGELAMRNVALVTAEGAATLVVEPLWAANAGTVDADVHVAGDGADAADPFDALATALAEYDLDGARLGIDLEGVPERTRAALRKRLPHAEVADCTNLLRLLRAVKSPAEIDALAASADVAERAAAAVLADAVPASTPGELLAAFRARVAADGADLDHFALAPRGDGFVTDAGAPLGDGEAMYADFGCLRHGWFSDSGTTLCVGEPEPAALADHAAARESVDAGVAAIRPGVTGSAVQAAMAGALIDRRIEGSYPHGHGLGLAVRDYPLLVPDRGARIRDDCVDVPADLPLEPGMVVNLEAPVLRPGLRSAHCERTFVVTATGCRPLLHQPREAPVVAAASGAAR
jgi:Xaa-Pro dipeptidase